MAEKGKKLNSGKLMTGLIILCCVVLYALVKLLQPAPTPEMETGTSQRETEVFTAEEFFQRAALEYGYKENPDGSYALNRGDGGEAAKLALDFDARGVYGFLLSMDLSEPPEAPKDADILESAVYELELEDYRNALEWLDQTVSALLYALDHDYILSAGDKQACVTLLHEAAEQQKQKSQTLGGFLYRVMPDGGALHVSFALEGK